MGTKDLLRRPRSRERACVFLHVQGVKIGVTYKRVCLSLACHVCRDHMHGHLCTDVLLVYVRIHRPKQLQPRYVPDSWYMKKKHHLPLLSPLSCQIYLLSPNQLFFSAPQHFLHSPPFLLFSSFTFPPQHSLSFSDTLRNHLPVMHLLSNILILQGFCVFSFTLCVCVCVSLS